MAQIKKYGNIYPTADSSFLSFMITIIEMCDFMLDEPEYKYSISYAKINALKAFAQSFNDPIINVADLKNELASAKVRLKKKKETDLPSMNKIFNKIKNSDGCSESFVKRYPIKGKSIAKETHEFEADFKMVKCPQGYKFTFSKHKYNKLSMNFYIKAGSKNTFLKLYFKKH